MKRWITWLCVGLLGTAPAAPAAETCATCATATIPASPSAPPQLGNAAQIPSLGCQREFTFGGKIYALDSWHRKDGERLRPLLQGVPEALNELDSYQETPPRLRSAAFITTAGLLLLVTGLFLRQREGGNSGPTIGNIAGLAGIGIAAGGVVYGVTLLTSNESYLERAVDLHNQARPNQPIQLVVGARALF